MVRTFVALLALGFCLGSVNAGQFNKKVSLGDSAPAFAKLPGVDGKTYALESFKEKDVLVIVFASNECPVSQDYEDRLGAFTQKYAGEKGRVGVLVVNVSLGEKETLAKMRERAHEKSFPFPYVLDETQQLGRDLGASRTPEAFVFNKDRKLVYTGAVDDHQDGPKVHYLAAAVEATLKGAKVETAETRARGCGIAYQKQ